ncbi:MAG: SusC/RagA family TonB-linked outer membrane protein [Chitinophagales bacterium]
MRKLLLALAAFLFFAGQSFAQRTITGKVTDEKGNPLPNASVVIKSTNTGTTTKTDGTYSITVPPTAKELIFTSVDMSPEEIAIGSKTVVNAVLRTLEKVISEVVVTGYTRERKREFTGAAGQVNNKAIDAVPVPAIDQMFQGRVAGLVANSGSGQPGASANVHIRGINSISAAGTQPLYIVDGVPLNPGDLASLNTNDFESITVLKDAGAAAMYGSRGSLGVVVITTKRGKAGQTNVQFRTQYGFTQRPQASQFNQMNSAEMIAYEEYVGSLPGNTALTAPGWFYSKKNTAVYNTFNQAVFGQPTLAAQQAKFDFWWDSLSKINTDYYDILFRTGISQTYEVNMSGGNGPTRYYLALNHFNQEGTDRKSRLKRYSARFNLDNTVGRFSLQFNLGMGYVVTDYNEGQFYAGNGTANPFAMVWRAKPYENPYRPDGSLIYGTSTSRVPTAIGNLIERSDNSTWKDKQVKVNSGLTLSFRILPSLNIRNTTGVDASTATSEGFINPASFAGQGQTYQSGFLNASTSYRTQLINTTGLVYSERLKGGLHNLEVGAYFEALRQWSQGFGMTLYNLDPRLNGSGQFQGTLPTTGAPIDQFANTARSGYGIRSYFANARYTFNNRYTATGVIRRDGTSRILLDENKEITTWSAGLAWDVMKEHFTEGQRVFTDLRVRGTYGKVPNINSIPGGSYGIGSNFYTIPQYLGAQQPQYGAAPYAGSSITGQAPGLANPNLRMETVAKANFGVDLGFWKNRVRLTVDYYRSMTEDLFVNQTQVATSGFYNTGLAVNAGSMSNRGLELDLAVDIVSNKDAEVTFKWNHGYNVNKIEDLGKVTEYVAGTGIIKEGLPYGQHYSYWYLGVDPTNGKPQYKKPDGTITNNISEGGQFHEFGTWFPKHVGGFSVDGRYHRFTVSAFFSYQFDVMRYNNVQNWVEQGDLTYVGAVTQSKKLLTQQWRKPGDIATIQGAQYSRQFTSYDITDAKFLRFRNLTVSYNIPELSINKFKLIKSGRFYIMGQNLAIWSPWSGLDPEDDNNISLSEFPNPKAVVVGIDINF